MNATQQIVVNGYRRAAALAGEARALHQKHGNTDEALAAYRHAAAAMAAAYHLDQTENYAPIEGFTT